MRHRSTHTTTPTPTPTTTASMVPRRYCLLLLALLVVVGPAALAFRPPASSPPSPQVSPHHRRDVVTTTTGILASSLLLLSSAPAKAQAAAPDAAREAIAKAASKLPGYGAPDTLYPAFFEGEWSVRRDFVGLTIPPEEADKVDPQDLAQAQARQGEKLQYIMRFLPYDSDANPSDAAVIADRAFNEEQLWRSRLADKSELYRDAVVSRWDRSNPNVLTVSFPDGLVREIKVTKRSFEKPAEDSFGLSEYCRVADAAMNVGMASVPRLSALRVLQRYKRTAPNVIEGLELVKYYPPVSLSADPPAIMTLKSRLRLEKIIP